ncbi:MAG: Ppx/GppA family phosphatase [Aestuariivirga sp.]|nr:Ppx/GppA family phosphatase [Aestuariivirga sp.]
MIARAAAAAPVLRRAGPPSKGKDVDATSRPGRDRPRRKPAAGDVHARRPSASRERVPGRLYGALDLGTNNCRLLIATPARNGFSVVDAFSRIVRLGERLAQTGRLSEDAMGRTIDALRVCANKLRWRKVERVRLVATEACRMAENGPEFIGRVKSETGLELEIIDRETEAGLAAVGAEPLVDREAETALVFDIGGGSTEVLWMRRAGARFETVAWTSLAAGVVTISERFGGGVDVTPASFEAMRDCLRPMVQAFAQRVSAANGGAPPVPSHLLGTSGTVTTIAGVQLGLQRYDRSRVDGCWLDSGDIGAVTGRLLRLSYEQRAANPCIGRERADLVLAGCAILEEIRLAFPAQRIRVADRGLREGILTMLMKEDGTFGGAA